MLAFLVIFVPELKPTMYDITLLTDHRWVDPKNPDDYASNILLEDHLLRTALEKHGLRVHRTHWDDPQFDWRTTRYAMFRTTWDYFDRFAAFSAWLEKVSGLTRFINPIELIRWNLDKHYLLDLAKKDIAIPATIFIEPGDQRSLHTIVASSGWSDCILKPAVSGAGRHTYKLTAGKTTELEAVYQELIAEESMLLQEFQQQITTKGEVALMVMGGQYTHAVLKKAKAGDFRVQDDFGGTVHPFHPDQQLIDFAENLIAQISPSPVYARVDIIWDNNDRPCVSELELIEPELWMRKFPESAEILSNCILSYIK
jgi:glutathione synthase/RimK-type ligase-like ATP-grasp enzyme